MNAFSLFQLLQLLVFQRLYFFVMLLNLGNIRKKRFKTVMDRERETGRQAGREGGKEGGREGRVLNPQESN